MHYDPPVMAQRFVLDTVADIAGLGRLPGFETATPDMVDAILTESARISGEIWAPLNHPGDRQGARLVDGAVQVPEGFDAGWRAFADGGWVGLNADARHGGQGLPFALACAVMEQMASANLSLSLLPMLTLAAIEALQVHGTAEQQQMWLKPLITGRWSATMVLTEPQAGSDVGALRTQATPAPDGSWRLKGQKIFITWGDHALAENIVHLVLARTPGAPDGTRGISLFIVPKFLVRPDGSLGARNDMQPVALEQKLGIHASPTCVMALGDQGECVGYLLGEVNGGMQMMFTMMNHARVNVGIQGVAIGERALQHAAAYARERVQSAKFGHRRTPVPIIEHVDVRRMLATGRGLVDAARAICMLNAAAVDRAHAEADPAARADAQGLADLLTPVSKAFSTDIGMEVASLAVQVFGGMGFIEETGAAQYYRDARIPPIYEGTNGIQALDLVGRKLAMDGGRHWRALFAREREFVATLKGHPVLGNLHRPLGEALEALQSAAEWIAENTDRPDDMAAAATPFLRMFGLTLGGLLLGRQALATVDLLAKGQGDGRFLDGRIAIARYYCEQILPAAPALVGPVMQGVTVLDAIPRDVLGG